MATILIAEDDKNIQMLVRAHLKKRYEVVCADDGEAALALIENQHIDLLIADIMMPRMDGFELVEAVREEGFEIPVIMLTASQTHDDKRTGFSTGIDDYLTKPVNYEELNWRIEALLRRSKIASDNKIEIGGMILNSESYNVSWNGQSVELPKKEFELLFKFLSYPGQIFTRNQLMDEIWGYDSDSGEETIKTHVSRLRNRFKDQSCFSIVTVKGLGYKGEIHGGKNEV
ncbi:response regulator transcription factor [Eubacteriaceae bacterium ES2]|nr:response regulator transcription factor [Eubacteriaceae bacterium ES2]